MLSGARPTVTPPCITGWIAEALRSDATAGGATGTWAWGWGGVGWGWGWGCGCGWAGASAAVRTDGNEPELIRLPPTPAAAASPAAGPTPAADPSPAVGPSPAAPSLAAAATPRAAQSAAAAARGGQLQRRSLRAGQVDRHRRGHGDALDRLAVHETAVAALAPHLPHLVEPHHEVPERDLGVVDAQPVRLSAARHACSTRRTR